MRTWFPSGLQNLSHTAKGIRKNFTDTISEVEVSKIPQGMRGTSSEAIVNAKRWPTCLSDLDSGRRVMASNNPSCSLTLFCWILGVSDHPFPVDIEDSRTVGHLKEAIVKKKPAAFANVDPDQLTLWQVHGFFLSLLT
jgi:hypothetical protein